MAENPIKNYIVGILLFGLIVTAGITMFDELIAGNNVYLEDDVNQKHLDDLGLMDVREDAIASGQILENSTGTIDGESEDGGNWYDVFGANSWSALKNFGNSFKFMDTMFSNIGEKILGEKVANFVAPTIIAIIGVIIAFAMLQSLGLIRRT